MARKAKAANGTGKGLAALLEERAEAMTHVADSELKLRAAQAALDALNKQIRQHPDWKALQVGMGNAGPKRGPGRPAGTRKASSGGGATATVDELHAWYSQNPSATVKSASVALGKTVKAAKNELVEAGRLKQVGASNRGGTKYKAI
jgi:predicted TIM-barrel fold metal-dependent hydrolase